MSDWHTKRNLLRMSLDHFGITEEQAARLALEELGLGRDWEATQDVGLFSQYDTVLYGMSCVHCFLDFSKGYAKLFAEWLNEHPTGIRSVIDYGCGTGLSTRYFAELVPHLKVTPHFFGKSLNMNELPMQAQYGVQLIKGQGAFHEVPVLKNIKEGVVSFNNDWDYGRSGFFDAWMFFEELEHEKQPAEVLRNAMDRGAKVICMANSFTTPNDLGHWVEYEIEGEIVPRKNAGRKLGAWMRSQGWKNYDTGWWNGRPQVWTKEN